MAPQTLNAYERRRLENIKRNDEMMASLKLHSKAQELSSATKRQRIETKGSKIAEAKKPKTEASSAIRRSLRTQGKLPNLSSRGLENDLAKIPKPINIRKIYIGNSYNRHLMDTIMSMTKKGHSDFDGNGGSYDRIMGMSENAPLSCRNEVVGSFDLGSFTLKPENVARVVPGRIMNLQFFPSTDRSVIVAGDDSGYVGFWDMDFKEGGDRVYLFGPHDGPISGILVQRFSLQKVITSSYDGFIRLMDFERESFDMIHSCEEAIFSLSQHLDDAKSLYIGKGDGGLNVWDERAGKSSSLWILHDQRINSIDFNPRNTNLMATSSTDGTACIWDLRNIDTTQPKALKKVNHRRAVHSAYFSPSGSCLATTSINDKIGILSGVEFMDLAMIHNNNQTGKWTSVSSSRRAIWGWDDSYLFIGNVKRGVDVLSTAHRKRTMTLKSQHMSTVPFRFAAHPYKVGTLAGATSGGQVYVWTSS